jgi:hypothetical protein
MDFGQVMGAFSIYVLATVVILGISFLLWVLYHFIRESSRKKANAATDVVRNPRSYR